MSTISIVPSRLADEVPAVGRGLPRTVTGHRAHGVRALDCLVVRVRGELDITGLDAFRQALSYAMTGGSRVVVDLRRTRFLSLRNALALVEAMDAAADVETDLLTGSRQIERALEVTGARARARRTVADHRRERRSSDHPSGPPPRVDNW